MNNPAAIPDHKISGVNEVIKGKKNGNGKSNKPYLKHRKKLRHDILRRV